MKTDFILSLQNFLTVNAYKETITRVFLIKKNRTRDRRFLFYLTNKKTRYIDFSFSIIFLFRYV